MSHGRLFDVVLNKRRGSVTASLVALKSHKLLIQSKIVSKVATSSRLSLKSTHNYVHVGAVKIASGGSNMSQWDVYRLQRGTPKRPHNCKARTGCHVFCAHVYVVVKK